MTDDFESWWELNGCREVYATQKEAAQAAWERAREKYSHKHFQMTDEQVSALAESFNKKRTWGF